MFAVVPAAGNSSRMNGAGNGRSKLLLQDHGGIPLLARTVGALIDAKVFRGVVVAARLDDIEQIEEILRPFRNDTEILVIEGGKSRQESVYRALQELHDRASFVLVHDGARPLCPIEHIREVADRTRETGAAVLAVPVSATLKMVRDEMVASTIPRDELWMAQTPQGFAFDILLAAHEKAIRDNFEGTDDCQLVERLKYSVNVVRGTERNLKVTSAEDFDLVRDLLVINEGR